MTAVMHAMRWAMLREEDYRLVDIPHGWVGVRLVATSDRGNIYQVYSRHYFAPWPLQRGQCSEPEFVF